MPVLNFKGKTAVENYHYTIPHHTLEFDEKLSVLEKGQKPSLDGNLIIEGDNLIALKALLPHFSGRVKVVCIDPPYNTGEEGWVYSDNVNNPLLKEWFGKIVDKDDLSRHDKWLAMMLPRLQLIKLLMAKDAIIAIAIDDNELFNLGPLMDELFGSENCLACAPWLSEPSGGKQKIGLRKGHEYVLLYHNGDSSNISQEESSAGELNLRDANGPYRKGREISKWGSGSLRADRPTMWFPLTAPDKSKVFPIRNDGKDGRWRLGDKNKLVLQALKNPDALHWEKRPFDAGITHQGKTERWVAYEKIRDKKKTTGWGTWLDSYGTNADATRELKEIFGEKPFQTPKPLNLFSWIVSLHSDENAVVLDCFAGSGTTGHAVLALNKEDDGERKFILVENGTFTRTITRERVARVIKGVKDVSQESLREGLGGTFSYLQLGKPLLSEYRTLGNDRPSFSDLARYVFFTETGHPINNPKSDQDSGFIGEHQGVSYYLLFDPEKSDGRQLDMPALNKISENDTNRRYVIYCEKIWVHRDDREAFEKRMGKSLRVMQLPFHLK